MRNRCALCVLAMFGVSNALAGPDWVEVDDAGSFTRDAQAVVGVGSLRTIFGSLSSGAGIPDFEDMYLIRITDPLNFRFEIRNANFNPTLWLFNVTRADEGFGLLANDDESIDSLFPRLDRAATDGSGAAVTNAGIYAIAITASGRAPTSRSGLIFNLLSSTEISGPDGPGGINPHDGWTGDGNGGSYLIELEGVTYVDVPAPGTLALAAGALAARRRRG
ncbi:MAG: hypothetical protein HRU70_01905 [Phycisphaeraceae bacterium]|nr:MAG: hypothetical protein HRU70_01905 [Phycisphaeraceae bacterium]